MTMAQHIRVESGKVQEVVINKASSSCSQRLFTLSIDHL